MKRFKNLLVVYDDAIGGDDALGQAVALARENSARISIVTIARESQLSPRYIDETGKRLQRLALGVRHAGVREVQTTVLTGTPFLEIIRQVIEGGHDLVIASAEAGSVLKNVFFGSTATQLMRKCPCPVWVVKPGQSNPYIKILVAVDPLPPPAEDPINARIMDLATSLASRDHASLHIVHAWDVDGNDLDTIKSELKSEQREIILQKHRRKHLSALRGLIARYPLSEISHELHLPRERPEQAISRIAEQEGIDLIVMGTVARTGVPGFFIGNAAESVLGSVKCGMLTVKPDGFETPVSLPEQIIAGNGKNRTSGPDTRRIA